MFVCVYIFFGGKGGGGGEIRVGEKIESGRKIETDCESDR